LGVSCGEARNFLLGVVEDADASGLAHALVAARVVFPLVLNKYDVFTVLGFS
jgi:hypothetical protein